MATAVEDAIAVIAGDRSFALVQGDATATANELPADSVDLVFTSPPYCDARTYGINAQRGCLAWVEWMLEVIEAQARICRGPVFVVAAGVTRKRNYWPACEGLMWEWWKRGGAHELYRPCAWVKQDDAGGGTGIPGSGGDDYLRSDWEYVMCFKRPGKLVWEDNTAMGHPPVIDQVGGQMSNRTIEGLRVNDPWKTKSRGGCGIGGRTVDGRKKVGPNRRANGEYKRTMDVTAGHDADGVTGRADGRPMPKLANPGNVVRARVGGGHMGSRLCHEGEAPFPERLAEFFIRSFCPAGGIVLDPFSGSGTTAAVAVRLGRRAIGVDLRESQVELGNRRLAEVQVDLFV